MKSKKKYREDLLEVAIAGFILGIGLTIYAIKTVISDKKEKTKTA